MSASPATAEPPGVIARVTRSAARLTSPLSRPLAGHRLFPLWAVLHHRGRRTGRAYAIPVAVRVADDTFTIALPWGEATQWVRNVTAAGGCTLRLRGADHELGEPRVVDWGEGAPAFNRVQRAILSAAGVRRFLRMRAIGSPWPHVPASGS